MGFTSSIRWGKRKERQTYKNFFVFFCSVLLFSSFYFLFYQSTWLWNRVSRLDLTMPWLSWGLKLHWAQNRCAWKLHILNWWLHKIRSRGNADIFGLELGRAVKKNVELLLQTACFLTWRGRTCSFRSTTSAEQWQGGDCNISPLAYLSWAERN